MQTWRRNFLAIWAANFITAVGMMAFIPLLPLYLQELGITDQGAVRIWSGVVIGAAPLVAACMGPVWGALGDRVGRKLMIVRANVAIVVFVGLMAFVTAPWQLLVLRLGQGLLSGYIAPSLTLVSVATPEAQQGRVVGVLQTAMISGMLLGPLLGGAIGDVIGLRQLFMVTAALSAVAVVIVTCCVREPPRVGQGEAEAEAGEGRRSVLGGASLAEGIGLLLRGVLRDVATVLGGGPLRAVLLTIFAVRFGAALVDPILALFVQTLDGVDPDRVGTSTGFVFASRAIATLLVTTVWGRIGDRHGHGRILLICAVGTGLSYVPQAFARDLPTLISLRLVSGVFLAGVVPAAYALASRHSSVERRGGAYGLTFSSLGLAWALGPLAGGTLAAGFGLRAIFFVSAACMLAAAWFGRALLPSAPEPPGAPPSSTTMSGSSAGLPRSRTPAVGPSPPIEATG